jgi:predicted metal-dependent hydrolase
MDVVVDDALRAGVALFEAGRYHAAHDPWEHAWLDMEAGTDDERLLKGLIQYTAAVHHARERNWSGATGLASSARGYLADVPDGHRGVDVAGVRASLAALAADPERVERGRPPALALGGERVTLADLDLAAAAPAAEALAEEEGYDERVVADAGRYAREERGAGRSRFAALVFDFLRDGDARPLIYRRLSGHVERRRAEERDVDELF